MEDLTEMVFNTPPSQVSTFEYIYTHVRILHQQDVSATGLFLACQQVVSTGFVTVFEILESL